EPHEARPELLGVRGILLAGLWSVGRNVVQRLGTEIVALRQSLEELLEGDTTLRQHDVELAPPGAHGLQLLRDLALHAIVGGALPPRAPHLAAQPLAIPCQRRRALVRRCAARGRRGGLLRAGGGALRRLGGRPERRLDPSGQIDASRLQTGALALGAPPPL